MKRRELTKIAVVPRVGQMTPREAVGLLRNEQRAGAIKVKKLLVLVIDQDDEIHHYASDIDIAETNLLLDRVKDYVLSCG